jgi:hypothetical protein
MLFIVYKQCARSRRVHIEDHMNRFEYCHPDNSYNSDSFGSFLVKKSYLLQHNSVLIFILSALFINNKQDVGRERSTRGRKRTLTDSEIKRNRSEVSSKWNRCRIYVGDQLVLNNIYRK